MPILSAVSVVLPLLGAAYAWKLSAESRPDTIGGAIGAMIGSYLYFAIACVAGEVAAIVALVRGDRPTWLAVVGVLLNLTAVIPPILFLTRKG